MSEFTGYVMFGIVMVYLVITYFVMFLWVYKGICGRDNGWSDLSTKEKFIVHCMVLFAPLVILYGGCLNILEDVY